MWHTVCAIGSPLPSDTIDGEASTMGRELWGCCCEKLPRRIDGWGAEVAERLYLTRRRIDRYLVSMDVSLFVTVWPVWMCRLCGSLQAACGLCTLGARAIKLRNQLFEETRGSWR